MSTINRMTSRSMTGTFPDEELVVKARSGGAAPRSRGPWSALPSLASANTAVVLVSGVGWRSSAPLCRLLSGDEREPQGHYLYCAATRRQRDAACTK